jgi:tetratricopeptide (TPR) repeat protein
VKKCAFGVLLLAALSVYAAGAADQAPAAQTGQAKRARLSTHPGAAYFNMCATLFNADKMDEAVAACDKSIALDPTKADAYFIKGSALFSNSKLGGNGKYEVPPGTVEALNRYLSLEPNGDHAKDAKAMLDALK